MSGDGGQPGTAIRGVGLDEVTQGDCPMQHSFTLDKCQVRCDYQWVRRQQVANGLARFLIEEPCEDGTRLCIQAHRDPRSSSRS
jgi:hypothetical protein